MGRNSGGGGGGGKAEERCTLDRKEQEVLAEEVRKYPTLYDPSHPLYTDLKQKDRAWNMVTTALGYEEGERESQK